jgi:hypothetical protein
MPVVGWLTSRVDALYLISGGALALFSHDQHIFGDRFPHAHVVAHISGFRHPVSVRSHQYALVQRCQAAAEQSGFFHD